MVERRRRGIEGDGRTVAVPCLPVPSVATATSSLTPSTSGTAALNDPFTTGTGCSFSVTETIVPSSLTVPVTTGSGR